MKPVRSALRTDINITPLIDIVLVLLIVFIVMVPALAHAHRTTAMGKGPGGPVRNLPLISVLGGGHFLWEAEEVGAETLVERLAAALATHPVHERKVILRIPAAMPLRMASEAMDLIHEAASRVGEGKDVRATLVEGEPIVPEGSGRGQGL